MISVHSVKCEAAGGDQSACGGGGGVPPLQCTTAPGCDCAVQLPDRQKGTPPYAVTFIFDNPTDGPLTITDVQVEPDNPARWTVDVSQVTGTLKSGEQRNFVVTFNPPPA